jgi:molecular chaperone GrpE
MSDPTARRPDDAAAAPDRAEAPSEAPRPAQPSKPQQAEGANDEAKRVAELVETLAREAAENKDKLLRALAEMENLRRRTERQVEDAREYSIAGFARDVLAVADNMDRALQALDAELREKAEPGIKALLDGVEITERELIKVLEKHGVRKFEPKGEKFDPNFHQAMYEVPDPSLPAGTVAQVVQAGYLIGERVLRPALVGIAKGGPKAPPAEADAAKEAASDQPANDNTSEPQPPPPKQDPSGAA